MLAVALDFFLWDFINFFSLSIKEASKKFSELNEMKSAAAAAFEATWMDK